MIKIIAAVGKNNELGKDNSLMWNLPGDMKFFRTMTAGSAVVMGRKTYESIGRPLPKRKNIVISRQPGLYIEGVEIADSLESALKLCGFDCFIIGGASVYEQALGYADEIILTEIDAEYPSADTFFPQFDKSAYKTELIAENSDGGVSYKHIKYSKN